MDDEMRNNFLQLFRGGPQTREIVYTFHEKNENTRVFLKGEQGIQYYEKIMGIAKEAGAPLDEVRERFIPLLDQERFDAYAKSKVDKMLKSGAFEKSLEKTIESLKAQTEEKRRRHEEAIAFIEKEKSKRSWLERLFHKF